MHAMGAVDTANTILAANERSRRFGLYRIPNDVRELERLQYQTNISHEEIKKVTRSSKWKTMEPTEEELNRTSRKNLYEDGIKKATN